MKEYIWKILVLPEEDEAYKSNKTTMCAVRAASEAEALTKARAALSRPNLKMHIHEVMEPACTPQADYIKALPNIIANAYYLVESQKPSILERLGFKKRGPKQS